MEDLLPRTSVRDLALIVLKRKWSIVAIFAATMIVFFGWLFLIHADLYQVDAKILVKIGREQAPPPSVMGASPLVIAYRSQDVNSEIQIFQSHDSVAKVVDELHLDAPVVRPVPAGFLPRVRYEFKRLSRKVKDLYNEALIRVGLRPRLTRREKVIFGLQRGLKVNVEKDSNVFEASLLLPERVGDARIMNALVDRYLALRQKIYRSRTLAFFQSATASSSATLQEAEDRLQAFESRDGIAELAKQESTLIDRVAAAGAALEEARVRRDEAAARVVRLKAQLAKPDPDLAAVGDFGHQGFQKSVLDQLADLQRERARLRLTHLDSGDLIRNNRQQFDALAAMLAANLRTALAEREQVVRLRAADYQRLETHLRALHGRQAQLTALKRHVTDEENTYRIYRQKLDQASADEAMRARQIGNVAVIERASDPLAPVGMSKTMLLTLAVIGAFLAAMVWVTIAEFFDHRVYTVRQLQRHVTVPVLAVVSPGLQLEAASRVKGSDRGPSAPDGFSLR